MAFRLLVDADVIELLQSFPAPLRRRLYQHFREIQKYPANSAGFDARDEEGRRLDVSEFGAYRIYYWTDAGDKHVKILEIRETD
jgi:hypothetical protein